MTHTPTEVKAAVTGSGRADKAQVTAMVTRILDLEVAPKPADAADALALAICHLWRGGGDARVALAAASERANSGPPGRGPRERGPPHSGRRHAGGGREGGPLIASVRGPVLHVGLDRVVVEVGGVGMLVHTTPGTASALRRGHEASLSTSLVVREDSLTLYGFSGDAERDMFEQVQTVSGVGPRLALAMLSVLAPDRIRAAISGGDVAALTKVPGIGKKGAERMVLSCATRSACPAESSTARPRPPRSGLRPGVARSPRRWSGSAGRPSRPTTPWSGSRVPRARARTSQRCSAPRCASSGDRQRT